MKYFALCLLLISSALAEAADPSALYHRLINCQGGVNNSSLRSECVKLVVKDGLMSKIEDVFNLMVKDTDPYAATWASFILVELRQGQYYELNRAVSKNVLMKYHQFIHDHGFSFRSYLDLGFANPLSPSTAVNACLLHADIDCIDAGLFKIMSEEQRKKFVGDFIHNFSRQYMEIFSVAQIMPYEENLSEDKFFQAALLYKRDPAKGKEAIKNFAQENSSHLCDYQMTSVLRAVSLSSLISQCPPMHH